MYNTRMIQMFYFDELRTMRKETRKPIVTTGTPQGVIARSGKCRVISPEIVALRKLIESKEQALRSGR